MALLRAVHDVMQREFTKSEPVWHTHPLSQDDLAFLKKECNTRSEFDPHGWRKYMFQRFQQGSVKMEVRSCAYGQVTVVYDNPGQVVPWGLWGRILRAYAPAKKAKIFFLAHPALRQFPVEALRAPTPPFKARTHTPPFKARTPFTVEALRAPTPPFKPRAPVEALGAPMQIQVGDMENAAHPIGPPQINGGYTYPCNVQTIVLYRAEDATRVLIHELQHASCLDHHEEGVDLVEAETEAWAELLYAGFLSHGNRTLFHERVEQQAEWMQVQNEEVRRRIGQTMRFPWRYTVGKENVWRRWGLVRNKQMPSQQHDKQMPSQQSLRLGVPPSLSQKRFFGVPLDSTIL